MNFKQLVLKVESGRDSEGCLEMVNGILSVDLGVIYSSESPVKLAEKKFLAFTWEETNCTDCGVFSSVRLFFVEQQPSKVIQTTCLRNFVAESFEDFQSLFGLLYPFLVES
jgi:hypothetical protein